MLARQALPVLILIDFSTAHQQLQYLLPEETSVKPCCESATTQSWEHPCLDGTGTCSCDYSSTDLTSNVVSQTGTKKSHKGYFMLPQVHAYAAAPEGRTAYLSELSTGQHVLVADAAGNARTAMVGRAKVEQRSLVNHTLCHAHRCGEASQAAAIVAGISVASYGAQQHRWQCDSASSSDLP